MGNHRKNRPQGRAPGLPQVHLPAAASPARPSQPPPQQVDIHNTIGKLVAPALAKLEVVRAHPVIAYYLADNAQLADEQVIHLYGHLRRLGSVPQISLWICSRGGATEVPWRIVALLREYCKKLSVLVTYRAHSAATHLALGADEIVMTDLGELGPVDPTRNHPLLPREDRQGESKPIPISVQDLRHVLAFVKREIGNELPPESAARVYTALFDKVHPLAIGALEQSWELARQITQRVLSTHMDPVAEKAKIEGITEQLSDYYKSHVYQIARQEARQIGLKVVDASADEATAMWELFEVYSKISAQIETNNNGEQLLLNWFGGIHSSKGSSLGFSVRLKASPAQVVGSRWESKWL